MNLNHLEEHGPDLNSLQLEIKAPPTSLRNLGL